MDSSDAFVCSMNTSMHTYTIIYLYSYVTHTHTHVILSCIHMYHMYIVYRDAYELTDIQIYRYRCIYNHTHIQKKNKKNMHVYVRIHTHM